METLLDNPNPQGLTFEAQQNMFDDIHKVVEDLKSRFVGQKIDFVEGYRQSDFYLAVKWMPRKTGEEFDLLFNAIPDGINRNVMNGSGAMHIAEQRIDRDGEQPVFVCDCQLIQGPEEVVPSFVRLVRPKNRVNIRRDILAPSLHTVLELNIASSEGEGCVSRLNLAAGDSQFVSGIVEGGTEVMESLTRESSERIGKCSSEPESVNDQLRSLRIRRGHNDVWACVEENPGFLGEIRNVFLGASDLAA